MDIGIFLLLLLVIILLSTVSADLKGRLIRVERKLNLVLGNAGIELPQGQPLSDRVKEIAREPGRKIEAIKVYREETGVGLAEAKQAVEEYIHSQS
jgi:ribosomal protein L7/L12